MHRAPRSAADRKRCSCTAGIHWLLNSAEEEASLSAGDANDIDEGSPMKLILGRVRRLELNALDGEASKEEGPVLGAGDASAAVSESGARLKVRAGSLLR